MESKVYDCSIIGGGLAGLSLAILLAQKKYSVLLIEKKSYPYHKVCGEYISNESRDFLQRLGIPLDALSLPQIDEVQITDVRGNRVSEQMPLGGFGISRYTLDQLLADRAIDCGVTLLQNTTCSTYTQKGPLFEITTNAGIYQSRVLAASFGRHSFGNFYKPGRKQENWVGVKYHISGDYSSTNIALHTFKDGYCGISQIDGEKHCLCYLVRARLLNQYQNKIHELEQHELYQNTALKEIFTKAVFLYDRPLTISNITFQPKEAVFENVFYLGDSAGAIAPLSGNGMSNAMRSAYLLSTELDLFFQDKITFAQLKQNYSRSWNRAFKVRIGKARLMQHFFCNHHLTSFFISILKKSKWLRQMMIRQTHGEIF